MRGKLGQLFALLATAWLVFSSGCIQAETGPIGTGGCPIAVSGLGIVEWKEFITICGTRFEVDDQRDGWRAIPIPADGSTSSGDLTVSTDQERKREPPVTWAGFRIVTDRPGVRVAAHEYPTAATTRLLTPGEPFALDWVGSGVVAPHESLAFCQDDPLVPGPAPVPFEDRVSRPNVLDLDFRSLRACQAPVLGPATKSLVVEDHAADQQPNPGGLLDILDPRTDLRTVEVEEVSNAFVIRLRSAAPPAEDEGLTEYKSWVWFNVTRPGVEEREGTPRGFAVVASTAYGFFLAPVDGGLFDPNHDLHPTTGSVPWSYELVVPRNLFSGDHSFGAGDRLTNVSARIVHRENRDPDAFVVSEDRGPNAGVGKDFVFQAGYDPWAEGNGNVGPGGGPFSANAQPPPASNQPAGAPLLPHWATGLQWGGLAMGGIAGGGLAVRRLRPGRRSRHLLAFVGAFSRLSRDALLDQHHRSQILAAVEAQPGVDAGQVCQTLELAPTTFHYHLRRLEKAGLIVVVRGAGALRLRTGAHPATTTTPDSPLTRILAAARATPGASSSELAAIVGMNARTVRYHLKAAQRRARTAGNA